MEKTPIRVFQSFHLASYGLEFQGPQVMDLTAQIEYLPGDNASVVLETGAFRAEILELIQAYPVRTDYWETLVKSVGIDGIASVFGRNRVGFKRLSNGRPCLFSYRLLQDCCRALRRRVAV